MQNFLLDILHHLADNQNMARKKSLEKYHLQAKPNKSARNKIWHAWWWEGGKRIYRSTGKGRKPDALEVIKQWEVEDHKQAAGTLRAFASDFFKPGFCPYLAWKSEQGGIKSQTIYEHRKNLVKYILSRFGDRFLGEPSEAEIERTFGSIAGLSGSTRNSILNTYRIIMVEAKRAQLIAELPKFRRFARRSIRKDIFTAEECKALFPDDPGALAAAWKVGEKDAVAYLFGLLFRLILHAGMRPSEGRAITVGQLYPEHNGVLIDRQLDSQLEKTLPKKGTPEDPRYRLVRIPGKTMEMLTEWLEQQEIVEGPIFTIGKRLIDKDLLLRRFRIGLNNSNIQKGDRILTPYSLRYTWRSRNQGVLEGEVLRSMMGHRSLEMSDHYLQVDPDQFEAMKQYQEQIDRTWE